jgi:protein-L-isoaspartate(D-aspartate) O-methyltransferase
MDRELAAARRRMVQDQLVRRGIRDPQVLEAMERVPRHMFVPPAWRVHAYADGALPLAQGQTISQPYIVAIMTQALAPGPRDRVLEIGTGSGYQTAVLAELAAEVYTVERHVGLEEEARLLLEEMGYGRVRFRVGDGSLGWPEAAPFDGILVTAGAPEVPPALLDQLEAAGGRLVIPIGDRQEQELYRYERQGEQLRREWITSCRFVPLVGESGWGEEPA